MGGSTVTGDMRPQVLSQNQHTASLTPAVLLVAVNVQEALLTVSGASSRQVLKV